MQLPVINVELHTKRNFTLELSETPEVLEAFQKFVKEQTGFLYMQSLWGEIKTQWDLFCKQQTFIEQPEVILEPTTLQETQEEFIPLKVERHNLIFNGASVRNQKVRLVDRVDIDKDENGKPTGESGYTRWLDDNSADISNWLQSIRNTFEDSEYILEPIPLDQPLSIIVDWLPLQEFEKTDSPTLNKAGELRVYKKKDLKLSGRRALGTSRSAGSPRAFNSVEEMDVTRTDFFYVPYIAEKTPDFPYTDSEGNSIKVTKIDMVKGTEKVPNHRWSNCLIQNIDRTVTYFNYRTLKRKNKVEKKDPKAFKQRTGFEGFRAQMLNGGYSEIFTTQIRKLRPDGSILAINGVSVVEEKKSRFRIACIKIDADSLVSTERGLSQAVTGSQYNQTVEKTNDVWLDIRQEDHTWKPFLIGRAHFSHMAGVYVVEECSTLVDNYKVTVRDKAKHILGLMKQPEDKTEVIQDFCKKFQPCHLIYQNDILYTKNSKGDLNPLYKRVISTYVPVVYLQHNPEAKKLLRQYDEVTVQCQKWLQRNHSKWFDLPKPKKAVSAKKRNNAVYSLDNRIRFMAKQTVRWGNPIFTDTEGNPPVTLEVIENIIGSAVVGQLDVAGINWLKSRHQILQLFTKLQFGEEFWDSCTPVMQSEFIKAQAGAFRVKTPDDLFSPANIGLAGDKLKGTPPQEAWFRLIEAFYSAVGVKIKYTKVN